MSLRHNLLAGLALAGLLAATIPARAGVIISDTVGSGVATVTADADFYANATSGLLNANADGTGTVTAGESYSFSTSAAAATGTLGLGYSSSTYGPSNADYEFLTADGSAAMAQLAFHYNGGNGQETVSFEDFMAEPGGLPEAIAAGATLIDYGAEIPVSVSGVTFDLADAGEPPSGQDVPEPASISVLGLGLVGMVGLHRLRRRAATAPAAA